MFDIDPTFLVFGLAAAMVGLAGFLLASWSFGLAATAGFVFLVLAPLTAADDLPFSFGLKFARIGATVFAVGIWFFMLRMRGLGIASSAWLIFILAYTAAGVYSDLPLDALLFKGILLFTTLTGFAMVASLKDVDGIKIMARGIGLGGSVFIFIAFAAIAADPSKAFGLGRLTILGMNSNRVGVEVAAASAFLVYLALYDKSRSVKLVAIALTAAAGLLIAITGSRAGLFFFLINALILSLPLVRRPVLLITIVGVSGLAGNFILTRLLPDTAARLGQLDFDTRGDVWAMAFEKIAQSPLIGHGWYYFQASSVGRVTGANAHSIYLQTAVETGVLGLLLLLGSLAVIGWCLVMTFRPCKSAGLGQYYTLAATLVIGPIAHGVAESSTLTGASPNALLLAIGVALVDLLRRTAPAILEQDAQAREHDELADHPAEHDEVPSQPDPAEKTLPGSTA